MDIIGIQEDSSLNGQEKAQGWKKLLMDLR